MFRLEIIWKIIAIFLQVFRSFNGENLDKRDTYITERSKLPVNQNDTAKKRK